MHCCACVAQESGFGRRGQGGTKFGATSCTTTRKAPHKYVHYAGPALPDYYYRARPLQSEYKEQSFPHPLYPGSASLSLLSVLFFVPKATIDRRRFLRRERGKEYPGGEGRQQPKVAGEEDGRKEGCFTQPATHPREESNLRKQAPRRRLRWRERRRRQRLRSLQEGREEDLKPYCTLSRAMWSSLTEPMASQRPWMEAEALVQPISPLFSNIGGQRSSSLASPLYATQDAATSVGKGTHSLPC